MNMKIVGITVTALVSLVVLAGVLMPVLDDATATTDTFTNEGYFAMNKITATDDQTHTIAWSSSNAGILVVDGVNIDVSSFDTGSLNYSIFATETDYFRIASDGSKLSWVQFRGGQAVSKIASTTFSATIGSGTVSALFDSNETPTTTTYTDAYIISSDGTGPYVMKKANKDAYMLADSLIYGMGITDSVSYLVSGDIEDISVTVVQASGSTVTVSNEEVTYTPVNGYVGLYSFSNVTFDYTKDATPGTATYSYVIVPHEVTAERSVHFTDNQNALLAVIPMLVIVAILIGVVALVIRSRMD